MQPCTEIVVDVRIPGGPERHDRAVAVAQSRANRAECEPCRRKARRCLNQLLENVGRCDNVSAIEKVQRPLVAPVQNQIAR